MDQLEHTRSRRFKRLSIPYLVMSLILGGVLVALGLGMRTDSPAYAPGIPQPANFTGAPATETPTAEVEKPTPAPTEDHAVLPTVTPPTPTATLEPTPTVEPTPEPAEPAATHATAEQSDEDKEADQEWESSPYTRLVVPKIGVDAPVDMKGLDPGGVMQDPDAPDRVVWYDFSAGPNETGNVVIAGHLDHASVGPAVFWHLGDLQEGDVIELRDVNDVTWRYQVTSVNSVSANADAGEVLASGDDATVTLITCNGTFNYNQRNYDERLIVRGTLVEG